MRRRQQDSFGRPVDQPERSLTRRRYPRLRFRSVNYERAIRALSGLGVTVAEANESFRKFAKTYRKMVRRPR